MLQPIIDPEVLLSHGATYKKVAKDEIIFMEGSHCCFYYQITSGQVRWVNINDEGKEFIQTILGEGESFGELPIFDDKPYAATAIANVDTTIIRLGKSAFLQLVRDNADIHFKFSRLFTERLRFKFLLIKEIASHGPEHCIASLFNYFKQHQQFTCKKCNRVTLTRQQIADMTGLRVETVIRAIRNLHDQGKVLIEKGKVYC